MSRSPGRSKRRELRTPRWNATAMSEEKVRNQGLPLDLLSDSSVAYRAEDGALVLGDARQLREIPDASVDLVITDPPFNVGISYGVGISDRLTEKQYQAFTSFWLAEMFRVLKPGGAQRGI